MLGRNLLELPNLPFPLLCRLSGNIPIPAPVPGCCSTSSTTSRSCSWSRHRPPVPSGDSWAPGTEGRAGDSPGWGLPLRHSPAADPREGRKEEGQSSTRGTIPAGNSPVVRVVTSGRSHHHQSTAPVSPGHGLISREPGGMAKEPQEPSPEPAWIPQVPTSCSHPAAPPSFTLPSPTLGWSWGRLEVTFPFLLHHEDTGWIFGKNSKLKR